MPIPKTTDVEKVMSFLKKEKPSMPNKQRIAIALDKTGKSKNNAMNREIKRRASKR